MNTMMLCLIAIGLISVSGHQSFDDVPVANVAEPDIDIEKLELSVDGADSTEYTRMSLMHKLSNMAKFSERGQLVIGRSKRTKQITGVTIEEKTEDAGKEIIEGLQKEQKGIYYQMSVPDLELISSVPQPVIHQNGMNDTLTFNLDLTSTTIISF